MPDTRYAITVDVPMALPAAREAVTALLKEEGFGVLTEIDVQATLKKKLDIDVAPYVILGACNPGFAHQAMQAEEGIGVLLPCNVAIKQVAAGKTRVWLTRVDGVFSLVDNDQMQGVADSVGRAMDKIAAQLAG